MAFIRHLAARSPFRGFGLLYGHINNGIIYQAPASRAVVSRTHRVSLLKNSLQHPTRQTLRSISTESRMDRSCAAAPDAVKDSVKDYYGKVLSGKQDLKTNVCTLTSGKKMSKRVKGALSLVHDEVTSKYYGCGLIVPECLEGVDILDLGSGSGQDSYVLSKLAGQNGSVTGIDMTEEQLKTARDYIDYHTEKFGFSKPNVSFVQGYIERLGEAGLKDGSFDIIVSNCVVNLSPDKKAVLQEAYRVLKDGGELYFSDIYADRDLAEDVRKHEVLWGECVAGALWWEDLVRLAKEIGFAEPLLATSNLFTLGNPELEAVCGEAKFVSATYRLFKLPKEQQPDSQVIYEGTVTDNEQELKLSHKITFKAGDIKNVNSEIATILKSSRFEGDFTFQPFKGPACSLAKIETMDPFVLATQTPAPSGGGCCGPAKSTCS